MKRFINSKILTWLVSAVAVVALLVGVCAIYVNDYYRADAEAVAAFATVSPVSEDHLDDGTLVYTPENAKAGLIFYPGGKVEHTAYKPLMKACAERGLLCVLVEMPFHLAVLDINAADGIREQYPEIESWYIGGHSLGGSMAASYLSEHTEDFDGLILLGSYTATDLSQTDLAVLSVYGSEDRVLNREKYLANKPLLPADLTEIVIEGGCHAGFGLYGAQDGDGTPTVSSEDQIRRTANEIAAWVA